jgi:hypothetical protein
MKIYFKRSPVPVMMLRKRPTTLAPAQVLSRTVKGKREPWLFPKVNEARRIALRICYDTLAAYDKIPERLRLRLYVYRRPRSVMYGIEVVEGRKRCCICHCDMQYEKFGFPVCTYHYRKKESDPPCPVCNWPPVVKLNRRERRS